MSKKPIGTEQGTSPLRAAAEEKCADGMTETPARPVQESAHELLHELQVHRIELEMQNETLRQSQIALEESRDRYIEFYDFAPVGYLTLTEQGLIAEINLTGAAMLGMDRARLLQRRFSRSVAAEDRDRWHRHFVDALRQDGNLDCDVTLLRPDGSRLEVRLDSLRLTREDESSMLRVVLTDIAERKRFQETLRASEQRFRDYVELAADWYWEQDADFRFTHMSGGVVNKGNFRIADSLGRTRWELPIEGVSESQWAEHRALLERHEAFHDFTYTIRAADDSLRWYSVSGKPVFASDGAFLGYRGTGSDISERKRAEAALRDSEQRFRDYAAMSADWFWEQDAEFRFTEVSYGSGLRPMTPHFYGRDSVGRHRWDLPYVNVPEGFWEEHRRLLEAGQPFNNLRLQRRDGESVRHVEIGGRPLFDDQGRVVGYRGTGRDITEQVSSREQLDKALRWLEQAIRAAGIGLWERDIDTWTFSLKDNWRALFGYAEDEIRNATEDFDRLVHPDDLARIHAAGLAYAANPQREYEIRFRIRHKDGSWRWVLSRGNVMNEPVTGRRTFVGCHLDITEQIQAEQKITELAAMLETRVRARTAELEEANRELDAFNFSVSHDLRTPLRAIEGFSRALLEDCDEQLDATGREYLRRICRSTVRMGELIDALYGLSRMAREPLRLGPVDLSAMASELVAELREQDRLREVAFEIVATPLAEGDARLLRIVLANLLGNAWKFTAKTAPARIVLGAQRDEEGRVIYFLRDNGAGFDMRFADKLFRIFHRLHREEEFPGQGVGLTTVQRIVARHGGRVWGEAERGAGATFYFTLWTDTALLVDALGNMEDAETEFR